MRIFVWFLWIVICGSSEGVSPEMHAVAWWNTHLRVMIYNGQDVDDIHAKAWCWGKFWKRVLTKSSRTGVSSRLPLCHFEWSETQSRNLFRIVSLCYNEKMHVRVAWKRVPLLRVILELVLESSNAVAYTGNIGCLYENEYLYSAGWKP